jgi:hypothetical protein
MEEQIGPKIIGMLAGDIEALLSENQSAINDAYMNIGKGMRISIGIALAPAPQGVESETKISFAREIVEPPEKCTAVKRRVMNENQAEFELSTGGTTILKGNTTDLARAAAAIRAKG